jgi:hypothetical protein
LTAEGLLQTLWHLELELHQAETRGNPTRVAELLHPGFQEIGRSGRRYNLPDVLVLFSSESEYPQVVADDAAITRVAERVALLTYRSAHVSPSGELERHTLRSSLWIRTTDGWQMRFHQGTPTQEY